MRYNNYVILFVILGLTGCTMDDEPKPWQKDIVNELTSKEWIRNYHVITPSTEFDEQEIRKFNMDATGYWKTIATYESGEKKEHIGYFKWSFTTEFFDIIFMDSPAYWEIKEFTPEKLCVYETYEDPIEVPGQTNKVYKEFTAKVEEIHN